MRSACGTSYDGDATRQTVSQNSIAEAAALALARIARYVPEHVLEPPKETIQPLLRSLENAQSSVLQYRLLATVHMLERWPAVRMQLTGGRLDEVLQRCLLSQDKGVFQFAQQLLITGKKHQAGPGPYAYATPPP